MKTLELYHDTDYLSCLKLPMAMMLTRGRKESGWRDALRILGVVRVQTWALTQATPPIACLAEMSLFCGKVIAEPSQ